MSAATAIRVLACCALAALAAPFAAAPAHAVGGNPNFTMTNLSLPRAAEKGRAPFLKFIDSPCGGAPGLCIVPAFHTVPKNRRLEVKNVACEVTTDGSYAENVTLVAFDTDTNKSAMDYFQPVTTRSSANSRIEIARGESAMTVGPGIALSLEVHGTGSIHGLSCKIAGETVFLK